MPGFGPAAEPLLFRRTWPKPLTPCLASVNRRDANPEKADQLAELVLSPEPVEGSKGSHKARKLRRASLPRASRQASDH